MAFIRVKDVPKHFPVSLSTLRRYEEKGVIPKRKRLTPNGHPFYNLEELEAAFSSAQ